MSDPIPQANPGASYHAHRAEIDHAVAAVLAGGRYIVGNEVTSFEREFGDYLGAPSVVGAGSGTEALHLALRACGIGREDAVITVSHTAGATVTSIELAGAIAVLVDVEPRTFTIDTNQLEDAIKRFRDKFQKHLKAIVPVHLYGKPADMKAILDIARRFDLLVIEDCSQSHGASIGSQKTGTWGDLAIFSFYPTKNLGAMGDGGAVIAADKKMDETLRMVREYGWKERYVSEVPGMNTRLDELQAAILRVKLKYLDSENARRRQIARQYNEMLNGSGLILPEIAEGSVFHQYVIRTQQRDELKDALYRAGIHTSIHYPLPVHLQPAYRDRVLLDHRGLPTTENICREILSLPIYPQLADEQVQRVGAMIAEWCKRR
ncbi:DegT/DnrJ/EryC1/StrS family aminotransferase [bacterium]|nr:DegT/DnrJ/EryC1/StrS family aminotransferase [bacterium]